MGLFDNQMIQSYINFATQDGTTHDFSANVLLYGPLAIALLLVVIAYQFSALFVTGLHRTFRAVTGRLVAQPAAVLAEVVVVDETPVVVIPAQSAAKRGLIKV